MTYLFYQTSKYRILDIIYEPSFLFYPFLVREFRIGSNEGNINSIFLPLIVFLNMRLVLKEATVIIQNLS